MRKFNAIFRWRTIAYKNDKKTSKHYNQKVSTKYQQWDQLTYKKEIKNSIVNDDIAKNFTLYFKAKKHKVMSSQNKAKHDRSNCNNV